MYIFQYDYKKDRPKKLIQYLLIRLIRNKFKKKYTRHRLNLFKTY